TGASLTRTGQFVGTVDYVAPEQIQGGDVDGRADVYSLGCVMYRCLTGEVPFPRDTEVATIYAQLQDPPPVPSERRPELPAGFDAPIVRALAKSRDDRFDTCRGFADAAAAVLHPPRPITAAPAERPRTSRRRIAFVSGGVAVAAGVAIAAALLLPARDRDRSVETSSPTTPGPLPQLTWSSVADRQGVFDGPDDQVIADAALVDGAIVAVGHDDAGGDRNAAVWTSSDGTGWTRAPSGSLGRIGEQRMDAVASVGEQLVAVGSERTGGDTDPAVWTSPDQGTTWVRVEGATSGLHGAGDQAMRVVVVATPGVVAAGYETSRDGFDAAVWTSRDGSSWIPLTLDSLAGPGDQQILGATTMGERLIVVGSSTSESGDLDAAVWLRSRGEWTKIPDGSLGGPGDQQIDAIVTGASGSVAVGSDTSGGDLDAAVWTSVDGSRWDRVPATDAFGGAGDQMMSTVAWAGSTLVAGGSSAPVGRDPDGAIWVSADGAHWKRAPAMEGRGPQRISSLISIESDRVLATGSQEQAQDVQAAAWIARLSFSDLASWSLLSGAQRPHVQD
ncbi:MAG: hypothetical protein ABI595_12325, partial [Actinomycetota bacterium]